jgi:hypothetical protein
MAFSWITVFHLSPFVLYFDTHVHVLLSIPYFEDDIHKMKIRNMYQSTKSYYAMKEIPLRSDT